MDACLALGLLILSSAAGQAVQDKTSAELAAEAARRLDRRDDAAALALAGQAIELDAGNASAWTYLAIADNRLRLYSAAVANADHALALAPGNVVALQTRAWAYAKQRRYAEALADAQAGLARVPSGVAFYNRAFALAGLGQRDAALESLRDAAKADARLQTKLAEAQELSGQAGWIRVFDDDPPMRGRGNFWRLALLSASGGLLFALAFLNIFSAAWRKRVQETVRRAVKRR